MTATAPAPAPVATTKAARRNIQQLLEGAEFKNALAKSLPKHLHPDRFVRVALTAMTKTPRLALCTQESFFNCLLTLSQYGIEPDGRRAHLIPFNNTKKNCVECQLIIDYKGLAEVALRSGFLSTIHCDVVSEGDLFEYNAGELKTHVPWFLRRDRARPADAGDLYAVYSLVKFRDGGAKCEVMGIGEVEDIRKRSKNGDGGPWKTDYAEMAKKTVFRRHSKMLPLSAEFRDAVDEDDKFNGLTVDVTPPAPAQVGNTPTFHVEPEPEDAPPGAEPEPAPPVEPAPAAPAAPKKTALNYLKSVRGLVKLAKFDDGDLLAYLHATGLDESLSNLDEAWLVAPSAIILAHDNWADVKARITTVLASAKPTTQE